MTKTYSSDGMLTPYRVLDLTDDKGIICGKLLADLGADVIKIEKPGGDACRNIGPFYNDETDPEKSLFWFAFNTNKKSITLNIETPKGQEIFKRLVQTADIVVESFPVDFLDKIGLGYAALEKINPCIILVSVTPFGTTGPYKDYKAPDIVAMAIGGRMYPIGDADRPPVRISHHSQAYLHAGGEAMTGAMLALYHREMTGEGQHVDVSVQASVAQLYQATSDWDAIKFIPRRGGMGDSSNSLLLPYIWRCKDGYIIWTYWGGGPLAKRFNMPLIEWMESEGINVDFLKNFDWENFDRPNVDRETAQRIKEPTMKFFLLRTKKELLNGAVKHRAMLSTVSTTDDLLESAQLKDRGYWVQLEHEDLKTFITYPGAFAVSSEISPRPSQRAPHIGEHNQEIYVQELGLCSMEELQTLKKANVI